MQRDLYLSKTRDKSFRYNDPLVQRLLSPEIEQVIAYRNSDASEGEVRAEVILFLEKFHPVVAADPSDPNSLRNELQLHRAINSIEREIRRRHDAIQDRRNTAKRQNWYVKDVGGRERAFSDLAPSQGNAGRWAHYNHVIERVHVEDSRREEMPVQHEPPRERKPGQFRVPARDPVYSSRTHQQLVATAAEKTMQPRYRPFGEREDLVMP